MAFKVAGFQDFVNAEAQLIITAALSSIKQAASSGLANDLMSEFNLQAAALEAAVSTLVLSPNTLADSLFEQISSLSSIAASPEVALSALRPLFGFGNDALPVSMATPSRQQQATNQAALIALVRQAAVIEAARVSATITPASYNEAVALRDELADQLETQAGIAPDAIYTALMDLRIAVIQDISARAADLSRIVQHPVAATQPALVTAHQLYGPLDSLSASAGEIVARNKIKHPGFVPGGQAIEVLTATSAGSGQA